MWLLVPLIVYFPYLVWVLMNYMFNFQLRDGKNPTNEADTSSEGVKEQHAMARGCTDIEISGKGIRWRKYGQKVVKGNLYPR